MTLLYSVQSCQPLASYVTRLVLQPVGSDHLRYQAGQYIEVVHADGSVSPLSIASAPGVTHQLELHLSHHPENASACDVFQQASVQKVLSLRGPYGDCTSACLLAERPIIFLARGTGFASIKALLEELCVAGDQRFIHLYWDVATEDRWYQQNFIQKCVQEMQHFQFTPLLSASDSVARMQETVVLDYPDLSGYQVYASGSAAMVSAAWDYLQQNGLPKDRFYSDMLAYLPG